MTRHRSAIRPSRLAGSALTLISLLALSVPSASAAEQSAARKVGRGFAEVIACPLEVPGNIAEESRINGPLYGATVGVARGLGLLVARGLVGVYEIVSSPFELPAGFEPILSPEYPWQYFEGAGGDPLDRQVRELARIPGARVERRDGGVVVSFPNDVLFETGSSELSLRAHNRLNAVGRAMQRYSNTTVAVTGYTDSTGEEDVNRAISQARADNVRRQILRSGIASARVTASGEGEESPVASNATATGRQLNRRVEVRLESASSGVAAAR